ncbi:hypothetical protein HMPREF0766_13043 [Sphingobacterium spiritivorum ATCC 33861]|uniref:Uncharacterized protein n=1 Tax=Sphingobacterium spiritivorum ATCC 33861 TaxID=525373 RepID=D7VPY9_SPHSI|nr:hypothetical protein HMPREF0766_13043 [Sphingobacterium spiritivorum ATCC 33861]
MGTNYVKYNNHQINMFKKEEIFFYKKVNYLSIICHNFTKHTAPKNTGWDLKKKSLPLQS